MAGDKIKNLKKKLKALRNKPNTGTSGRKKVDVLNGLAFALHKSDPQKTEAYARQALALADKTDYRKGIATSHKNIGISYSVRGNADHALEYCLRALKIYKEIGDKKGIAESYGVIGIIYDEQSDSDRALKYYLKSLKIKKEINDNKGIAVTYNNIGVMYNMQSNYEKALKYHLKALKIWEEIGDKIGIADCNSNIGNIYHYQSDHAQALEYYLKSLKLREEIRDKKGIAISCNNIGVTYDKKGNFDQALEYHLKALKIREKIGEKDGIAGSHHNIGEILEKRGDYAQALKYYLRALKIEDAMGYEHYIARSYNSIGNVHTHLRKYDSALTYLQKGLQLAQEIGAKYPEMKSYESLSELYAAQQNFEQAFYYYRKYTSLQNQIFNTEKSKQIAEMKTKYETEKTKKEAEIYHLKNVKLRREITERKKVEKELKKHRDHLEKLVEDRTVQLRSLAHELSLVEEKQRRKIATHLHDDISQALALVTFKLKSLRDFVSAKNIKKELIEIKKIVDQTTQCTRSLTCEISPPVLYELGLEPAVEWLTRQFHKQHGIACDFKDDGASKPMTDEVRVLLFQSVRELLTNVSKHARANSVIVSTLKDGNSIRIEVEDDGVGFDPQELSLKIKRNQGFGLFNLKERLRHLHGQLEVESKKEQGTSVVLVAPLKQIQRTTKKKGR